MTPHRHRRPLTGAVLASVAGALAVAGCNRGGGGGDTASFCNDVHDNIDYLRYADFQNVEQVNTVIDLFKQIGKSAPLEIEPDWDALVLNLETARDSDLTNPTQVQAMYARAYATEPSAVRVVAWLHDHCSVELGPVVTIVSHDATTSTAPASTAPA